MQRLSTLGFMVMAMVLCMCADAVGVDEVIEASGGQETVYRLNSGAQLQEGCFDGCACPLLQPDAVSGTLVLGPRHIGNVFDFREVREVNWLVHRGDDVFHIAGDGVYQRTNFGEPYMHMLTLDLSIDGGPVQHFFSELVPVESNDGSFDIAVSMNGMYCYDTVIDVDASPVPIHQIRRYVLGNASTFQRGCWDPCDCPLEAPRPLVGGFALVPVLTPSNQPTYSVVQAWLLALPSSNDAPPIVLSGAGHYQQRHESNGLVQRMSLWLTEQGANGAPMQFDSGDVPVAVPWPHIGITVDMNGQVCFDTVLNVSAARVPTNAAMPNSMSSDGTAAAQGRK